MKFEKKAWIFKWVKCEKEVQKLLAKGWELRCVYDKHWGKNPLVRKEEL